MPENMEKLVIFPLKVHEPHAVGLGNKHRLQSPFRSILWDTFQAFSTIRPALELPKPIGLQFGTPGFIRPENKLRRVSRHRIVELSAGGVFGIVILLRVEKSIKGKGHPHSLPYKRWCAAFPRQFRGPLPTVKASASGAGIGMPPTSRRKTWNCAPARPLSSKNS